MLKKVIKKLISGGGTPRLTPPQPIDVLVTWPSWLDYPIWRWYIRANRDLFNKVLVTFYSQGEGDVTRFLYDNFPEATFLVSDDSAHTWRGTAVNVGLNQSHAPWVWFTEQDFIWKSDHFFDIVFAAMGTADVIAVKHGDRLHPCCLFAKRSLIDRTSRNFDPAGKDMDHFSVLSKEIKEIADVVYLEDLGLLEGKDWFHMSSLTWNYQRAHDKDVADIHNLRDFLVWNYYSRVVDVPQTPEFLALSYWAEAQLTDLGYFLNRDIGAP